MRILLFLGLLMVANLRAEPEYPRMGPDIYDTAADGKALVSAALMQAKAEHKHVLVKFGANWCIWCRRLHAMLEENPTVHAALTKNYVLVQVDVNHRSGKKRNEALIEQYGNPVRLGLPVLIVLDADGKLLTTQDSGQLEDGKEAHDPVKVVAFLQQWAPKN